MKSNASIGTNIGLLILRVVIGGLMVIHGSEKVFGGVEGFSHFVGSLGFPAPLLFAWLSALSEFGGGILLILGLLGRVAALFMSINMSVAVFMVHYHQGLLSHIENGHSKGMELALLYLVVAFSLIFTGMGDYSLDAIIFKGKGFK